jgi:putative endonuclease
MLTKVSAFFMTFFVYVLQSQVNNSFYKGSTNDLQRRLAEHNTGKEKSTSRYLSWNLVWFAAKPDRSEAVILEKKLKNLSVKRTIEFINKYPVSVDGFEVVPVRQSGF